MAAGSQVLDSATFPFPDAPKDFSGLLQQARQSGATVLGLCGSGADTNNAIKQARAMGLQRTMRLATLLMIAANVRYLGLEASQGLLLTETFYWDLNDRTRAFADRIRPRLSEIWKNLSFGTEVHTGHDPGATYDIPDSVAAGNYAATLHYLKAVADLGVAVAKADGAAVVARMKAMPTDDDCFGRGRIREDGRKLHPAYLFQVKTPAESTSNWDVYKVVATTPAEQAFRPLSEGGCPLVKS
jgi:branched-chain amino acid transport system substrate-binding protein